MGGGREEVAAITLPVTCCQNVVKMLFGGQNTMLSFYLLLIKYSIGRRFPLKPNLPQNALLL